MIYHDDAREEGFDAAAWYAEQQGDLGYRFLAKWKEAEGRILAAPEFFRCIEGELRMCRLKVFPYALILRIGAEEIEILAVMHMRREPGYFRARGEKGQ